MWYQNQYFKADHKKGGQIVIPYAKSHSSDKTILINDGFAQLTEFKRLPESYSFSSVFIVNHESLLMGKEAEILMKPSLKVNDRKCNLNIMKGTKVTLTTMSFVDNMPITKVFDNLTINNDQEISVKFQVPPNLQSVDILLETEVTNVSKGNKEKLTSSHNIQMGTNNNTLSFYDSYLRKLKQDYYYYALGKNGEALSDINVSFTFNHNIYTNKSTTVPLNTDDDGKVKLGPLNDIVNVSANFRGPNGNCSANYVIRNTTETVVMPFTMNILEDEEVKLPYVCNHEFSQDTVTLVRYSSSFRVIENCFKNISFSHDKGYQYGRINISGLQRGHYTLTYVATMQTVSIRVHKGVYWETDSFILKDHSLVEKRERTSIMRIKDIAVEEEKENHKVSFSLDDYGKNARAHVYAFTFMPPDVNSSFDQLASENMDWSSLDIFPFAKWKNIFLSNRKLGDEFRYVFDRKFVKRFMGNTLDRPQLLINRHKIRDTQFDNEVVNAGNEYEKKEVREYDRMQQQIAPTLFAMNNMMPQMQQQMAFGSANMMTQN